tara:strand:- start:5416 stop:5946 length:531 start_codon:yes stop_codon:yes gene_type:complete
MNSSANLELAQKFKNQLNMCRSLPSIGGIAAAHETYSYCDEEKANAQIERRVRMYLDTKSDRIFRYGQWVVLILSVVFVSSIVVMMAFLAVRLEAALSSVDGKDATEKLNTILTLSTQGAENARMATQNVLHVTEYARNTTVLGAPRLERAMNETSQLVEQLRSWSFHPSLSIAPG